MGLGGLSTNLLRRSLRTGERFWLVFPSVLASGFFSRSCLSLLAVEVFPSSSELLSLLLPPEPELEDSLEEPDELSSAEEDLRTFLGGCFGSCFFSFFAFLGGGDVLGVLGRLLC